MRPSIFPFLLLLSLALPASAPVPARAGDEPAPPRKFERPENEGELTFCHFGPKVKVLSPAVNAKDSSDECTGTAKIQAVLWECAPPEQTDAKVEQFRKRLLGIADDECRRHCQARASGCRGKLRPPTHCGLQTDREDAVAMGKRMGCRKDCAGPAFVYCSLFDARFRTEDAELIAKQAPNCHCSKE